MVGETISGVVSEVPPEWVLGGGVALFAIAVIVYVIEARRLRIASERHRTAVEAASLPTVELVRRPYGTETGVGNLGFSPALNVDCTLTLEAAEENVKPRETTIIVPYLEPGHFVRFSEPPLSELETAEVSIAENYDEITMSVEYDTIGDRASKRMKEKTYSLDGLLLSGINETEPITEDRSTIGRRVDTQ